MQTGVVTRIWQITQELGTVAFSDTELVEQLGMNVQSIFRCVKASMAASRARLTPLVEVMSCVRVRSDKRARPRGTKNEDGGKNQREKHMFIIKVSMTEKQPIFGTCSTPIT